jgi:hypothetical protein
VTQRTFGWSGSGGVRVLARGDIASPRPASARSAHNDDGPVRQPGGQFLFLPGRQKKSHEFVGIVTCDHIDPATHVPEVVHLDWADALDLRAGLGPDLLESPLVGVELVRAAADLLKVSTALLQV